MKAAAPDPFMQIRQYVGENRQVKRKGRQVGHRLVSLRRYLRGRELLDRLVSLVLLVRRSELALPATQLANCFQVGEEGYILVLV